MNDESTVASNPREDPTAPLATTDATKEPESGPAASAELHRPGYLEQEPLSLTLDGVEYTIPRFTPHDAREE